MRKRELIHRVAARTYLPDDAVRVVLQAFVDEIVAVVGHGEPVALDGFGRFRLAAQTRRSASGAEPSNDRCSYVAFRSARRLKAAMAEKVAEVARGPVRVPQRCAGKIS